MPAKKFNPFTPNNEIGIYITKSRPVTIDTDFGELATWVKCGGSSGILVWYNKEADETNVAPITTGEAMQIAATSILSSATIDTVLHTTTATDLYWMSTAQHLKAV